MMAKLVICFCICLVVFLGSLAGFCKSVYLADSENSKVEVIGTTIAIATFILTLAGVVGLIAFAIKLFIFYLYGSV
ncbi:MAG: hypothetical protein IKI40_09270 [Treponema sp.]|nr:hypothetical protein [Treponema sp.]